MRVLLSVTAGSTFLLLASTAQARDGHADDIVQHATFVVLGPHDKLIRNYDVVYSRAFDYHLDERHDDYRTHCRWNTTVVTLRRVVSAYSPRHGSSQGIKTWTKNGIGQDNTKNCNRAMDDNINPFARDTMTGEYWKAEIEADRDEVRRVIQASLPRGRGLKVEAR